MNEKKLSIIISFLLAGIVITSALFCGCIDEKPSSVTIGDTVEINNWEFRVVSVERENELYSGPIPTPLNPFGETIVYNPTEGHIFMTVTIQIKNTADENNSISQEMIVVKDDKHRSFLPEGTTSNFTGFISAHVTITMPPGNYIHEKTLVYVIPLESRCLNILFQDSQSIYLGGGCNEDRVRYGDNVEINYISWLENGSIFDTSYEDVAKEAGLSNQVEYVPLKFTAGARQIISGVDEAVIGMKRNEEKTVILEPEEAYGYPKTIPRTEIISLESFEQIAKQEPILDILVQPENFTYPIKVIDINDSNVTIRYEPTPYTKYSSFLKIFEVNETHMSWGHPLAGQKLTFEIKLENFQ